jgi:hypothetical protein
MMGRRLAAGWLLPFLVAGFGFSAAYDGWLWIATTTTAARRLVACSSLPFDSFLSVVSGRRSWLPRYIFMVAVIIVVDQNFPPPTSVEVKGRSLDFGHYFDRPCSPNWKDPHEEDESSQGLANIRHVEYFVSSNYTTIEYYVTVAYIAYCTKLDCHRLLLPSYCQTE